MGDNHPLDTHIAGLGYESQALSRGYMTGGQHHVVGLDHVQDGMYLWYQGAGAVQKRYTSI